jgi:DNA processing protein
LSKQDAIISGLALGVDATAHEAAIEGNGKTVAVLGSGVDYCTPRENVFFYENILEHQGAIVSEFPLGQLPTIGSFPSRNRIIAGLSLGVVVTEGAADSGSLITAKDALANGRKVFAVPGPVTSSLSQGPNQLLKNGATLVSRAKEILEELKIGAKIQDSKATKKIEGENSDERRIIDLLQNEPLHFDALIRKTHLQSSQLGSLLSLMEMKGFVKSLERGIFALAE